MNRNNKKDFIFLLPAYIIYATIGLLAFYIYRDNLVMGILFAGVVIVPVSVWFDCALFCRKLEKEICKIKDKYEQV